MSKNTITIKQLNILCRHVNELLDADFTENIYIRHLELCADIYAKELIMGINGPYHADQIKLWSKDALKEKRAHPKWKYGRYLRVEHGTPRRQFARLVLKAFEHQRLVRSWMNRFCHKRWKVAVITHAEDKRLARSKIYGSPEVRWRAAGIEF